MLSSRSLAFGLLHALFTTSQVLADTFYSDSSAYTAGSYGAAPYQIYNSSALEPPALNLLVPATSAASTNHTLLSYRVTGGQNAPIIIDNAGSLVWSGNVEFGPSMDLTVQEFNGEPVLTLFNGSFNAAGYGLGTWLVLAQNYSIIASIDALNQTANTSDFHEMVITPNNTALVEAWRLQQADLTAVSGESDGWTFDCVFQEVDIASNTLMFEWSALEHVSIDETYFEIADDAGNSSSNPFDWCHINALEKTNDGNYLISMRGPSTVYHISATTGEILYRLGGKNTNFTMGDGAEFYYQHDARLHGDITASTYNISIFDNGNGGGADAEATARGIVIQLDTSAMTATLVREYIPSFNHTSDSQGSMTLMDNGNVFIGWGATPYFSEYTADGTLIQDTEFGANTTTAQSYRAFKQTWVGYPTTVPSFGLNSSVAYASWNGATEITQWLLLGGNSTNGLTTVSNVTKTGFETALTMSGTYTYVAAAALDSAGGCLGVTNIFAVSNSSSIGTVGTCPSGTSAAVTATGSAGTASASTTSVKSGASMESVSVARTGMFVLATAVLFTLL